MLDFGVLFLLLFFVVIGFVIWIKRVVLVLFVGVWIGGFMVFGWNFLMGII